MNNKLEFSVGSDVDFEDLVADIGFDGNLVALLTQEEGFDKLKIRIYPPKNFQYWEFSMDDFETVLFKAKNRLKDLRKPS